MGKDSELIKVTKEYSEFTKECKKMAEQRRARSPVRVERTNEVLANIDKYVSEQYAKGKPLTHAGFCLAFGIGLDTYYSLNKYDYIIEEYKTLHNLPQDAQEYITPDGEVVPLISWSDIQQKCSLLIQQQLEENCYTNKGNPAGSIFGLKARYQWAEDSTPATVNNNLVIADGEQARKVLAMLND